MKMTKTQKLEQHRGSRFIRVIRADRYAHYIRNEPKREYDSQGRRTK